MIAIICGGRDYVGSLGDQYALDRIHHKYKITEVISGEQGGADRFGEEWSKRKGIPVRPFPVKRDRYRGGSAGPIRNAEMVKYCDEHPDAAICIALPGTRGTTDMVMKATNKGIPVVFISQGEITWPSEERILD